jgi:hypothetical protein
MANAHKPGRQDVQEEAANELDAIQHHDLLLVPVRVVLPVKINFASLDGNQTVVGDRHPVGVARQVFENGLGAAERRLGVDDPILLFQGGDQLLEEGGIFQVPLLAMKRDLPTVLRILQEA